jgi:hypothetical protein
MAETIFSLIILSIMVASIAWTLTQEEVFSEFHDYCEGRCETARNIFSRKFFYLFTCEYCFSHWVTLAILLITDFHLIFGDWRGLVIAFFVLPWLANQWMSIYRRLRVGIKHENVLAEKEEKKIKG